MDTFIEQHDLTSRSKKEQDVLLTPDQCDTSAETRHLLSTPANAERINQGLRDYANEALHPGELCN